MMQRNRTLSGGALIAVALGAVVALGAFKDKDAKDAIGAAHYSSQEFGVSFDYPEYYALEERDIDRTHRVHHSVTLVDKAEVGREATEGPTAITLDIYQNNLDHQTAKGFIVGSSDSNYKLGDGHIATTTYGMLEGLEYEWSGLYEGRSFVVANPDYIYLFSVTRMDPSDRIIADFNGMLKTAVIR